MFHIFLDRHRDALKLETLIEAYQFERAKRLVGKIYLDAKEKWDPLSLENIQATLERDRRLIEEIRRLQVITYASQYVNFWKSVFP